MNTLVTEAILSENSSRLSKAIGIAALAHSGQRDRQGEPIILHSLRVMLTVSQRARTVAVLHDVIEDTGMSAEDLSALCGARAEGAALDLLTRDPSDDYAEYIEKIATSGNHLAVEVKRADLWDNLRPCPKCPGSLRKRYVNAIKRLAEVEPHT